MPVFNCFRRFRFCRIRRTRQAPEGVPMRSCNGFVTALFD